MTQHFTTTVRVLAIGTAIAFGDSVIVGSGMIGGSAIVGGAIAADPQPAAKRDQHHDHATSAPAGASPSPSKPTTGATATKPKPAPGKKPAVAPMPYPGGLVERNAARIGVDDATIKKMRATFDGAKKDGDALRKKIGVEQTTLRQMMEKDVPDEAAVMAQADKIGALGADLRKSQLRAILAVRGMLTPEQRAEVAKIRAEQQKK
jgi:Spy/CpxP family protein refolding chaperone